MNQSWEARLSRSRHDVRRGWETDMTTATATPITTELNGLLADYQVLYQKLRTYHWTVKGPHFFELHVKFEELYNEAALHVDELAERVLALHGRPLATLAEQLRTARLVEDDHPGDAMGMVAALAADYDALNERLRAAVKAADAAGDDGTVNLLEPMADGQEKTVWMLRAFLG